MYKMQRLEVSGAVRLIYRSLGVKGLIWAMYSGDVGHVVGTRSRTCHGGWGDTRGNCYYVYLS